MAKREVVWTKTADIQFIGVLEYWVERNKSTAYSKKLIRLVTNRTKQVSKTPYIFKSTEFQDTRVASLGYYSIYYKITDDYIIIISFWDNRQNPKQLLKILKG